MERHQRLIAMINVNREGHRAGREARPLALRDLTRGERFAAMASQDLVRVFGGLYPTAPGQT